MLASEKAHSLPGSLPLIWASCYIGLGLKAASRCTAWLSFPSQPWNFDALQITLIRLLHLGTARSCESTLPDKSCDHRRFPGLIRPCTCSLPAKRF